MNELTDEEKIKLIRLLVPCLMALVRNSERGSVPALL